MSWKAYCVTKKIKWVSEHLKNLKGLNSLLQLLTSERLLKKPSSLRPQSIAPQGPYCKKWPTLWLQLNQPTARHTALSVRGQKQCGFTLSLHLKENSPDSQSHFHLNNPKTWENRLESQTTAYWPFSLCPHSEDNGEARLTKSLSEQAKGWKSTWSMSTLTPPHVGFSPPRPPRLTSLLGQKDLQLWNQLIIEF